MKRDIIEMIRADNLLTSREIRARLQDNEPRIRYPHQALPTTAQVANFVKRRKAHQFG